MQSCSYLASKNILINFYWVSSYLGIYRNEIVDKLAKKGLFRRKIQSSYTTLLLRDLPVLTSLRVLTFLTRAYVGLETSTHVPL